MCTACPPRAVDDLVRAMGGAGVSKSQVSRLCADIDERVQAFLERRIEGRWPYLWLDATPAFAGAGSTSRSAKTAFGHALGPVAGTPSPSAAPS